MKKKEEIPLRLGVGIILLNNNNEVLVGKRIDNPKDFWQMPQGGVNDNEDFFKAAKRELEEETGVKSIKLIKELKGWFSYDLPENLMGKVWDGKYRGQKQKWFVMKFLGDNKEINIKTEKPELLDWKWIPFSEQPDVAVDFKLNIYKKIAKEISTAVLDQFLTSFKASSL